MKYNYEKILTVGFKDIERQIYDAVCRAARQITKDLLEQLDKHLMNTRDKKRYGEQRLRQYMGKSNITGICITIKQIIGICTC